VTDQDLDILADKIASRLAIMPRWMNLKQAVMYSNIGKGRLIELTKEKTIKGFQDNSIKTRPWRFDKESIDMYMESQIPADYSDEIEKTALDILSTVRL